MEIDRFITFPIYPLDKTSTEGMMFVSTKLNADVGLIKEMQKGIVNYLLTSNAKRRRVSLYGEALSVNNFTKVPLCTARQLTRLGTEK